MATQIRGHLHVDALQNILSFGPWDFWDTDVYDEIFAAQIDLGPTTLGQIIGGVSPSIQAITTLQYLCIVPDQVVRIGLHGVNAQLDGFTLHANKVLKIGTCGMTSLSLYNTTIATAHIIIILGGHAS